MADVVVVEGLRRTQIALKVKEKAIHDAVVRASKQSEEMLVRRARQNAPGRVKAQIFGKTTNPRRLFGNLAITTTVVSLGVAGKPGIWWVGGTGIHKLPEFGGPGVAWNEESKGFSDFNPHRHRAQGFDGIFRKFTHHEGQGAHPVLDEASIELAEPIQALFRAEVHAAVELGG